MSFFRASHVQCIQAAVQADPKIISSREDPQPFDKDYLHDLGLSEALLKRMERVGLAAKAYRNEKRPDGYLGGFRQYWCLFAPGKELEVGHSNQGAL